MKPEGQPATATPGDRPADDLAGPEAGLPASGPDPARHTP